MPVCVGRSLSHCKRRQLGASCSQPWHLQCLQRLQDILCGDSATRLAACCCSSCVCWSGGAGLRLLVCMQGVALQRGPTSSRPGRHNGLSTLMESVMQCKPQVCLRLFIACCNAFSCIHTYTKLIMHGEHCVTPTPGDGRWQPGSDSVALQGGLLLWSGGPGSGGGGMVCWLHHPCPVYWCNCSMSCSILSMLLARDQQLLLLL